MTITHFNELMAHAKSEKYAIGYFESWSLESFMAIADAAEATQSPVLLGFSGIYLGHPKRVRSEILSVYSTMGLEICNRISIPAALVFNESPYLNWVQDAIDQGFGLVMFSDEQLSYADQTTQVLQIVEAAHQAGVAVEEQPPGAVRERQTFGRVVGRLFQRQSFGPMFAEPTRTNWFAITAQRENIVDRQQNNAFFHVRRAPPKG